MLRWQTDNAGFLGSFYAIVTYCGILPLVLMISFLPPSLIDHLLLWLFSCQDWVLEGKFNKIHHHHLHHHHHLKASEHAVKWPEFKSQLNLVCTVWTEDQMFNFVESHFPFQQNEEKVKWSTRLLRTIEMVIIDRMDLKHQAFNKDWGALMADSVPTKHLRAPSWAVCRMCLKHLSVSRTCLCCSQNIVPKYKLTMPATFLVIILKTSL